MEEETTVGALDQIVGAIADSGELDLSGFPPEVLIAGIREAWQDFLPALEALSGLYNTLGLLLGELDNRIVPLDSGNPGS